MPRFCFVSLAFLLVTLSTAQKATVTTAKTAQGQTINVTMPAPVVNVPQIPITVEGPKPSPRDLGWLWSALIAVGSAWAVLGITLKVNKASDGRKARALYHQERAEALRKTIANIYALGGSAQNLTLAQRNAVALVAPPLDISGADFQSKQKELGQAYSAHRVAYAEASASAEAYGPLPTPLQQASIKYLHSYIYNLSARTSKIATSNDEQLGAKIDEECNHFIFDLRILVEYENAMRLAELQGLKTAGVQIGKEKFTCIGNYTLVPKKSETTEATIPLK